jgi:hypothetical protein
MLVNGIQSQISAGELSFIFNEVEED